MAAFDPDAYLASSTPVELAFDPDAYLSSRQNVGAEPRTRLERTNLMPPTDVPAVISYDKQGRRLFDGQAAMMAVPVDKTQEAISKQNVVQRVLGEAAGALDVPLSLVGALPAAMAYGNVPSGSPPEAYAAAQKRAEQARLYSPQTPQGQRNLQLLGEAFQSELLRPLQGAIGLPLNMLPSGSIAPVNQLIRSELSTAAQPIRNIAQTKQQANIAQSFQRAPQIDAAKEAARLKIELDPSVSNPTLITKGISVTTEAPKLQARISEDNLPKYANIAKREMGLPKEVTLSGMLSADNARAVRQKMGLPPSKAPFADESPFDLALEKVAKPYDEIAKIKRLEPDEAVIKEIDSLRSTGLIGSPAQEVAISKVIDDALTKISQGTDGQTVISSIADLRKKARKSLNSPAATPEQIDLAEVRIKIADSLENLIDANVTDSKLLSRYRQARTDMAKIYGYERATDKITGVVDVQKIAKELNKNPRLTGDFAALGKIAGVYPESTQMNPALGRSWQNFTRAGAGGTIGAGLGGAVFGTPGVILGGALGAGLGGVTSSLASKLIRSPGYQASMAVPQDFRPPVNMLRPAPPSTTQNLPVPFNQNQNALRK